MNIWGVRVNGNQPASPAVTLVAKGEKAALRNTGMREDFDIKDVWDSYW